MVGVDAQPAEYFIGGDPAEYFLGGDDPILTAGQIGAMMRTNAEDRRVRGSRFPNNYSEAQVVPVPAAFRLTRFS